MAQLLVGARVLTMDDAVPEAEALRVQDGRVTGIGTRAQLSAQLRDGDDVVELGGGALLPGFIDAHHHVAYAALDAPPSDLRLDAGSPIEALLERVAAAARLRSTPWVYLVGFEAADLRRRRMPTADELEQACPGRPLFLQAANGHEGVLNRSGLVALGLSAATSDPAHGTIGRRRGRLTGFVSEFAAFAAEAAFRDRIIDDGEELWIRALEEHAARLLSLGVTRVGDAAVAPLVQHLYARAAEAGRLPLTVHGMPVAAANLLEPRLDGPPTGSGPSRAPIGPAKLFLDGGHRCAMCFTAREGAWLAAGLLRRTITGAGLSAIRSARRIGPPRGTPDGHVHVGLHLWEQDALTAAVRRAGAAGLQVAQHAIGNRAIETGLRALERSDGALDAPLGPPRLEHVVFPRQDQIRRLAAIGAAAVVQPSFLTVHGDDMLLTPMPPTIGMLPLRDLHAAGVPLAFSSDYPVADPNPLAWVQAAVTRRTASGATVLAEQALDVHAALRAATLGAAQALGADRDAGSIKTGKVADLVHLQDDPTEVQAEQLSRIRVLATWVDGRRAA